MTLSFAISAFVAGLVTFFAPCTFPLVPGYLGFISGVSLQELNNSAKGKQERRKIILNALYFVAGFSCIFIIFGALAGLVGLAIVPFRIWFERIGGVFVILFGLFMIGAVSVPFFDREKRLRIPSFFTRGRPVNSFILGGAFALGWTPCVGPILGTILLLASTSASLVRGIVLLGIFSAGLAIPFLIIAASIQTAARYVARLNSYLRIVSIIGGLLLIILGVLLVMGNIELVGSYDFLNPVRGELLLRYL